MKLKSLASYTMDGVRVGLTAIALLQFAVGAPIVNAQTPSGPAADNSSHTTSPIKHLIVIIGENRSFDHVFATYQPVKGETVDNLLSKGIIKLDSKKNAIPGPNFNEAHQLAASDLGGTDSFLLNPPKADFPNNQLPAPLVGGAKVSYVPNVCAAGTPITQCAGSLQLAQTAENGLDPAYYPDLLSGGTGLTSKTPDTRITNVTSLPAGPFQLTNSKSFDYDAYAASPVHRFYQMWQQLNCGLDRIRFDNPSGCNAKLFSWVEVTVGAGTNGVAQSPLCSSDGAALPCFTTNYLPNTPGAKTWGEGSTALGFYNVQQGDVPYFKSLADNYAMSDNFHQSVQGGTGANHIMFGHGDAIWFSDGKGNALTPPNNVTVAAGTPNAGIVDEVENPNPQAGTNNWYAEDGYGGGSFGAASFGGGPFSDCADATQP